MNERIRELAKQCWNERWEGQLHFDNEKFAELIVKECLAICEELGDKGLDGHYCADKIARHFRAK
jgi:hypothetical protein